MDPQRLSRDTLQTVRTLARQLSRVAWPSCTALRAMHDYLAMWAELPAYPEGTSTAVGTEALSTDTSVAGVGARAVGTSSRTVWDVLDDASGYAPAAWVSTCMAVRPRGATSLAGMLALLGPVDLLPSLRALMLQSVRFHSNRAARAAAPVDALAPAPEAGVGAMLELPLTSDGVKRVFSDFSAYLAPMMAAAAQAQAE